MHTYGQARQRTSLADDVISRKGIAYIVVGILVAYLLFQKPPTSPFSRLASEVCTQSPAERPDIQYALVVDAGSTGSRIHVYRFNYCLGLQPTLEDEVFQQLKPGLGSFDSPLEAAKSLDKLMAAAMENVPASLHNSTPLVVKATAGLRMLENGKGEEILNAVRSRLADYPFIMADKENVAILGGDQEGVLAWITLNYLLGTITSNTRKSTVGILDLGGGSTQIVYEGSEMQPGKHVFPLDFNGQTYKLYQHSYDGYGLMQGRLKVTGKSAEGHAPCIPIGRERLLNGKTVKGTGIGFDECETFIESNLFTKSDCPLSPCAMEGIYMPEVGQAELYAFSYFYDNYAKLFGQQSGFTVGQIKQAAQRVCKNDKTDLNDIGLAEFKKNNAWCMDLGFMYSLLRFGYSFSDTRYMKTAKKIDEIEIGWSLGLAIQILDRQLDQSPKV